MIPRAALLLGLAFAGTELPAAHSGVEVAATDISIPFFDAAGNLTHKLVAKRGAANGDAQTLEEVEVVYLSPGGREITQRVRAEAATWRSDAGTLSGAGSVYLESGDVRVSGQEFRFVLDTSVLTIERNFRMANPDLIMTSDRAVVLLALERSGDQIAVQDVKHCEAIGHLHVVVTSRDRRKFGFDEAFSARAIYDGAAGIVTLPDEVRFLREGREARSKSAQFKLPARNTAAELRRAGKAATLPDR